MEYSSMDVPSVAPEVKQISALEKEIKTLDMVVGELESTISCLDKALIKASSSNSPTAEKAPNDAIMACEYVMSVHNITTKVSANINALRGILSRLQV